MKKTEKHGDLQRLFTAMLSLAALLVGSLFAHPLTVQAVDGEAGDTTLSLTVELLYDGETVEGVEASLFYVGRLSGDALVPEGRFAEYAVTTVDEDTGETDWEEMALTLAGYAYLDGLEPDVKASTDEDGMAYFPLEGEALQEGVYLVLTQTFQAGDVTCSTQPFLVILPDADNDPVIYQVIAEPKVSGRIGAQKLTVYKYWDVSDGTVIPDSVDITLVSDDGDVWGTVTLSEENSWRYTFSGLSKDCSWYIVEDVPDGYTVLQSTEDTMVILTNTEEEEESDPTPSADDTTTVDDDTTAPASGDDTTTAASGDDTTAAAAGDGTTTTIAAGDNTTTTAEETTTELTKLPQTGTLWWVVPILACCGMVSVLIGVAKKRGQEEKD